jgi:hypothetical protein
MTTTIEPTPFTLQLTLSVRSLKAAAMGCIQKDSDQPFRRAMHCVALDISPAAVVAVGLSERKMVAAYAGEGIHDVKPQTLLIPRKIIDRIKLGKTGNCMLQIAGLKNEHGSFLTRGLKGSLSYDGVVLSFDFQDDYFPQWRQLCDTKPATGEAAHYATAVMADIQKAYNLFFEKKTKNDYIRVLHNGNNPARVVFAGVNAFAVVMPLNLKDDSSPSLPEWAAA